MQILFASAASLLNIVGYIPYIRDILRGIVKPQRITWGVWTILTSVAAVNQILNDGGYSSLFLVSATFLVATTFALSFKYGMGGASRLDIMCLVMAFILLVYWVTIQDTRMSTLLAVVIDAIGAIPTLVKTYKHPETETYTQWVLAGIGGLLTMLAVTRVDWALLIFPAYIFAMNGAIVATKYIRERQKNSSKVYDAKAAKEAL